MRILLSITIFFASQYFLSAQFFTGDIERYYLTEDFQGLMSYVQKNGGKASFAERSVIEEVYVKDKIKLAYLDAKTDPYYHLVEVEIGRTLDGKIKYAGHAYSMTVMSEVYDIPRNYILPLLSAELFTDGFDFQEEYAGSKCQGVKVDWDYHENMRYSFAYKKAYFDTWQEYTRSFLACKGVTMNHYYSWDWGQSKLGAIYKNDLKAYPLPEMLKTDSWYRTVDYLSSNNNRRVNGGYFYLFYEMEESILATMLGMTNQLYEEVKLEKDQANQFFITPLLNGLNQYKMLFDTGASLSTLAEDNRETFLMLGLVRETDKTIEMVNADGVKSTKKVFRCNFTIGSKEVKNVSVVFTEGTPLFGMNILNELDNWRIEGENLIFKK